MSGSPPATVSPPCPEDARDREELLAMADRAMFSSKGRGKDRIMLGRTLTPVEDSEPRSAHHSRRRRDACASNGEMK